MNGTGSIVQIENISHWYGKGRALDNISAEILPGRVTGLIGPDGVGKSTFLAIAAGARRVQAGRAIVLGGDMADGAHRSAVCARIAYMPQGLGKNLYPDLSVKENIEFFARLFGLSRDERNWRIPELLASTNLAPFVDRLTKDLSGGMRQKLGLCCSLIHDPELLILDEPTTGVDPLSRRQFWKLIDRVRSRQEGMTVLVATAYMEEAEQFEWLLAMNGGKILSAGSPSEIKTQTSTTTIEDAFISLLPHEKHQSHRAGSLVPHRKDRRPIIVARDLTCRFGEFTAVDHVSFTIARGEIFGFVGSNGCGKTTTMKLLTGLLPASDGQALLFGKPIGRNFEAREHVGYMSQSFSLYTELTVLQNLTLHARLFHIDPALARQRINHLSARFGLSKYLHERASKLPLGIRQRVSLAVAVIHEPDLLILDEPTSGVDPVARDQFWDLLTDLARNQGVTIFVSTHFMSEAARCDRLSLMHAGRVLATDTPQELAARCGTATLEEAFIRYLEAASAEVAETVPSASIGRAGRLPKSRYAYVSFQRVAACTIREGLELIRDPIRLMFASFGTALLMIVFGFGVSTDVNNLTFAVLDRDNTHESRAYLEELRGSPYFVEKPALRDYDDLDRRLKRGDISASIEIPPGFGENIKRGRSAWASAWIDGAMPFRGETIKGYLQGMHQVYLADPVIGTATAQRPPLADIEVRFKYNQDFDSIYAMVPSTIALLLALFPAILMALAIVREKELGSITNLYVTPVTRLEFLVGKQLPYIVVALTNFSILFAMAVLLFKVPLKGSFLTLLSGVLIYVTATTAYGMLISAFCSTQIAALFGTAILTILPATQFAGLLTPVSSLSGFGRVLGSVFPMSYFLPISVGTFTKGLGIRDLFHNVLALTAFVPVLTTLSLMLLEKQEK